MLIELKKVLSKELKGLFVQQDYHSPIWMNSTKKNMDVSLLHEMNEFMPDMNPIPNYSVS
jgi:hypothetical protein